MHFHRLFRCCATRVKHRSRVGLAQFTGHGSQIPIKPKPNPRTKEIPRTRHPIKFSFDRAVGAALPYDSNYPSSRLLTTVTQYNPVFFSNSSPGFCFAVVYLNVFRAPGLHSECRSLKCIFVTWPWYGWTLFRPPKP